MCIDMDVLLIDFYPFDPGNERIEAEFFDKEILERQNKDLLELVLTGQGQRNVPHRAGDAVPGKG